MDKRTSRRLRDTIVGVKTHRTFVFVAALVRRGKVLAVSTNRISASSRAVSCATTVAYDGTCTVHAERAVVRRAGKRMLRDACIVVWRDQHRPSAPCKSCEAFLLKCIRDWGLRGVFYTASRASESASGDKDKPAPTGVSPCFGASTGCGMLSGLG